MRALWVVAMCLFASTAFARGAHRAHLSKHGKVISPQHGKSAAHPHAGKKGHRK